MPISIET